MRKIGRTELDRILKRNACEILFIRRRPERASSRPFFRRMICSNSMNILNTENGIRSLNFHPPRGGKQLNENYHKIVVVWDIIMQDYRNVSMDKCFLVETIKEDDFWDFYSKKLQPMSAADKLQYMDSL
jgi:hypothetical protein